MSDPKSRSGGFSRTGGGKEAGIAGMLSFAGADSSLSFGGAANAAVSIFRQDPWRTSIGRGGGERSGGAKAGSAGMAGCVLGKSLILGAGIAAISRLGGELWRTVMGSGGGEG